MYSSQALDELELSRRLLSLEKSNAGWTESLLLRVDASFVYASEAERDASAITPIIGQEPDFSDNDEEPLETVSLFQRRYNKPANSMYADYDDLDGASDDVFSSGRSTPISFCPSTPGDLSTCEGEDADFYMKLVSELRGTMSSGTYDDHPWIEAPNVEHTSVDKPDMDLELKS